MMKQLIRVKSVTPLDGHKVFIKFEDNTEKEIDLNKYLHGPIFESIRNDEKIFQAMKTEDGTIAWENGADIDPDVLYYGLTPAWMEEPLKAK